MNHLPLPFLSTFSIFFSSTFFSSLHTPYFFPSLPPSLTCLDIIYYRDIISIQNNSDLFSFNHSVVFTFLNFAPFSLSLLLPSPHYSLRKIIVLVFIHSFIRFSFSFFSSFLCFSVPSLSSLISPFVCSPPEQVKSSFNHQVNEKRCSVSLSPARAPSFDALSWRPLTLGASTQPRRPREERGCEEGGKVRGTNGTGE